MTKSICGADCANCAYGKDNGCKGCDMSGGCPNGKQCFIYKYIRTGVCEDEKTKEKIDRMHKANLFKLQLMPVFPYEP